MKRIEAFIQPHRLNRVVAALHRLERFPGFTVLHGHGQGHGRGTGGHHAFGSEEGLLFHDRRVLVVICEDDQAGTIVDAIRQAAHTGTRGDGVIAVSEIAEVLRIGSDGGGT